MRSGQSIIGLIISFFLALVAGTTSPGTVHADWTGNINVSLGSKALEEDDWSPVESQSEFAVEADFRERPWPLNMVIGLRGAYAEEDLGGLKVESATSELSLGVRKIWDSFPHVRPFVGGGLSLISAEIKGSTVFGSASLSDSAPGIWLGGGVYWALTPHFNLGFDLRFSSATVTLGGIDGEAGGGHFGVLLGYHY